MDHMSDEPGHQSGGAAATPLVTRRRALGLLGMVGGVVGLGAVAAACGGDSSSSGPTSTSTSTSGSDSGSSSGSGTTTTTDGTAATDTASCVLTPEVTEGPYYVDADLVRRDITEGKAGMPVELAITVLDADTCMPVRDAAVDIWHCDAGGIYSGYEAASTGGPSSGGTDDTRYLRGTQVTGADGVATFDTIYPGWYRGRAVHIHMKVHANSSTRHTGQLFFTDDLSALVYETSPYDEHGSADMSNAEDSIFRGAGGEDAIVAMTSAGDGYRGAITVGITQG
jgi:protocatechuate 3,4-dioxygenase beta subunit